MKWTLTKLNEDTSGEKATVREDYKNGIFNESSEDHTVSKVASLNA